MTADSRIPNELVVCSLEAWDDVWRRNQLIVDRLLRRHPDLRVLFVESPHDLLGGLRHRQLPPRHRLREVAGHSGLRTLTPVKPLPRVMGQAADRALCWQVRRAASIVGFSTPALWVNDLTYAALVEMTGWPSLYDITDDWLLEPVSERELARRRRLDSMLLESVDQVVVCSPALAASRGATRDVALIPNGVDVAHFTSPRSRPSDLPPGPVAVYVGTLHDERLDVDLLVELAIRLPDLAVILVGPDALSPQSRTRVAEAGVHLLGPRPYIDVPAYLQHADVVIVPHRVTPFTESLDPIKAYECLAIGRPVVATPVTGFRYLEEPVTVVPADRFTDEVSARLDQRSPGAELGALPAIDWDDRVESFEAVLANLAKARTGWPDAEPDSPAGHGVERGRGRKAQHVSLRAALRQDVARQLERTPSAVDVVTSLLLYRGLQATALYRIARWCVAHRLRLIAEILVRVNQLLFTVDIAHQASIGPGLVLRHPSDIVIGRGCKLGENVTIFNGVTLGNRFSGSASRPDGSPTIGDAVFIGTGAKILGPVEVGLSSVIGANAVVTRSVPPGSTVVGNPAQVKSEIHRPRTISADLAAEVAVLRRRIDELERRVEDGAANQEVEP